MPVIALVGNKGGARKTTLAVNLADALSRRAPTVILDADPQRSALQWRVFAGERGDLTVMDASDDPADRVRQVQGAYRHIIITDCPHFGARAAVARRAHRRGSSADATAEIEHLLNEVITS